MMCCTSRVYLTTLKLRKWGKLVHDQILMRLYEVYSSWTGKFSVYWRLILKCFFFKKSASCWLRYCNLFMFMNSMWLSFQFVNWNSAAVPNSLIFCLPLPLFYGTTHTSVHKLVQLLVSFTDFGNDVFSIFQF